MVRGEELSICALIAVRNELDYLQFLLPKLSAQNIDVIIFDNESNDGCKRLYKEFYSKPIIEIVRIPYRGYFSLTDQLRLKSQFIQKLDHNWIVHQDADEILEHREGKNLRAAIEEAEEAGYDCLNFDEFVFLPEPGFHLCGKDYYHAIRRYYFFEPMANRLNRAFKKTENIDLVHHAGHRISGKQMNIYPINHILRHYITLSQDHVYKKYLGRTFDPLDLARGWHRNRSHFTLENLELPLHSDNIYEVNPGELSMLNRTKPLPIHFWDWSMVLSPTV